ncbi:MAG TPA: hypothetical protein VEW48_00640 [Thermoanaerobaculia bacterium]|nr:hypothetical protein [Thermoanaerobaculia bacterium]
MERSFVMKRNILRGGVGALLLSTVLGAAGIASAEPARPARVSAAAELAPGFWSFLVRWFLDGQAPPPPGQTGSGGGEGTNGGGAMDPNGGASGAKPHNP